MLDDLPYATVRAIRAQIRDEIIEECARVAETCPYELFRTRAGIAAAIRALKEKT